jgi:uncharacterized membrane protein
MNTKVLNTLIVLVIAYLIGVMSDPAANLASNVAAINQVDNSNSSSYAVQMIGNGSTMIHVIIAITTIVVLYFIWRKDKEEK